jgi:hypothetical protein
VGSQIDWLDVLHRLLIVPLTHQSLEIHLSISLSFGSGARAYRESHLLGQFGMLADSAPGRTRP